MRNHVVVGATCGLAWAAALRGWMAELVTGSSGSGSEVTWLTLALVLLPGTVVGALLGYAAHQRSASSRGSRWLVLTPVLLAAALLDPEILAGLVEDGTGGGSLLVILTALATAHALTRSRWSPARALSALVGVLGLGAVFATARLAAPPDTPRGLWVALLGSALVLLLGVASTLPHRSSRTALAASTWVALGALAGFAWAGGLRTFMAQVAVRDGSDVTWTGTFGWILAPGLVTGALLGWAGYRWRHGGPASTRWLALAPLAFAAMLVPPVVTLDLDGFLADGVGGGTIGVPLTAIAGAWAIGGVNRRSRVLASVLPLSAVPIWALTATDVAGASLELDTARGWWAALLYWSLLAVMAIACAVPLRVSPVDGTPASSPQAGSKRAT